MSECFFFLIFCDFYLLWSEGFFFSVLEKAKALLCYFIIIFFVCLKLAFCSASDKYSRFNSFLFVFFCLKRIICKRLQGWHEGKCDLHCFQISKNAQNLSNETTFPLFKNIIQLKKLNFRKEKSILKKIKNEVEAKFYLFRAQIINNKFSLLKLARRTQVWASFRLLSVVLYPWIFWSCQIRFRKSGTSEKCYFWKNWPLKRKLVMRL